jgi:hypothetical protein
LSNSIISKAPTQTSPTGPHKIIYENNPDNFGKVQIALYQTAEYFHTALDVNTPCCDAVIGLNAGVGAYQSWVRTLFCIHHYGIPFVFSDHSMADIFQTMEIRFKQMQDQYGFIPPSEFETKLNPFHSPINRDIGIMVLPNINNGYLMIWRGKSS